MGLFSLFRKPRVSATYLDSNDYVRATPKSNSVLPTSVNLPAPSESSTQSDEQSKALAEMLIDASQASEDTDVLTSEYVPLEPTDDSVLNQIIESELPERIATSVQLNALFARDHEAWMRSLESDLKTLSTQDDSYAFRNALQFRNEQLDLRRRSLKTALFGLINMGLEEYKDLTNGLNEKIAAINTVIGEE